MPTLVLAAHPDDETIGLGGWLSSHTGPLDIAFLTDGVPEDARFFAPGFGDPRVYAETRRREARRAWRILRPDAKLHFGGFRDQGLAYQMPAAFTWLQRLVLAARPRQLFTPAFEGGHPDHDVINCLASLLATSGAHGARVRALSQPGPAAPLGPAPTLCPAWEYALYCLQRGRIRFQYFPRSGAPHRHQPGALASKCRALAAYRSQAATLAQFDPARETWRPLPRHAYGRPARPACVYERWQFPITARQVSTCMRTFLCES